MEDVPILILAAGAATRMRGADKLLEKVDGQPLLAQVADRALATGQPVLVALRAGDTARAAALGDRAVTRLSVADAAEGLSGSMRNAVAQLPPCPAFLILLADLPEITTADIAAVLAARDHDPGHLIWRGATPDGKPGHPILFDAALRPAFAQLTGDTGGAPLVKKHADRTRLVRFADARARRDLDTPEDWAAWRATRR